MEIFMVGTEYELVWDFKCASIESHDAEYILADYPNRLDAIISLLSCCKQKWYIQNR